MRAKRYIFFVFRITSGNQGEDLSTVKVFLYPTVVYATNRSKAMVLVLFLFCVGRFTFSLVLLFSVLLSIVITSLGEDRPGLCASRAVIY